MFSLRTRGEEMIKDYMDLLKIRHSRLIDDPFPEHSFYESIKDEFSIFEHLFGMVPDAPKEISIHKAYKMGYDKAYKEIEEALK
jgi:hypothetical protein